MTKIIKGKTYHHLGRADGVDYHHKIKGCDFKYNDGGRSKYFKGDSGDCVVRSISIASDLDYKKVYDDLFILNQNYIDDRNNKLSRHMKSRNQVSPRNGNHKKVYHQYILGIGFKWGPLMTIGRGCKFHLRKDEVPEGTAILSLSKHLSCIIDGVINDTYNPDRAGMRCIYGYYEKLQI